MDKKQEQHWLQLRKNRKAQQSAEHLLIELKKGSRAALSQAITLVESTLPSDRKKSKDLMHQILPLIGHSVRIGITGVPGVGKSTFIETFGELLASKGHKVAVLAIDPSSSGGGGSILGDKTRMQQLSVNPSVFIRPSAAGKTLGGVARMTRESIFLCEAAGFDVILVETVGVGQSETLVHSMVDFFLLLMLAGAGDELQGMKRGIMELADAIVITKADQNNQTNALMAAKQYGHSLHLFPAKESNWIPKSLTVSALENKGVDSVWEMIASFVNLSKNNGWFEQHRKLQEVHWMREGLKNMFWDEWEAEQELKSKWEALEKEVLEGKKMAFQAAEELYALHLKKIKEVK